MMDTDWLKEIEEHIIERMRRIEARLRKIIRDDPDQTTDYAARWRSAQQKMFEEDHVPEPEDYDPAKEWEKHEGQVREENKLKVRACAQKIKACFDDVKNELGHRKAWALFLDFTKQAQFRPPKRKKGAHDPEYNRILLETGKAPHGGYRQPSAAPRQLARLRAKAREENERLDEVLLEYSAIQHRAEVAFFKALCEEIDRKR